ncbi:hypothetical protein [Aliihoeflea sp. PC F10.4]
MTNSEDTSRNHRASRGGRSGLLAIGTLGLAVGIGAGIYHGELVTIASNLFGAGSTSAQEAQTIAPPERPDELAQDGEVETGVAQSEGMNSPSISDASASRGTTSRLSTNPFEQHIEQSGIQTCSALYAALGDSLTGGSSYGIQSFWNESNPDANAIEGIVGLDYQSEHYAGPAAGYVFASPNGAGCNGAMVRVASFQAPCSEIPNILPEGSTPLSDLGQVGAYRLSTGGQALLLPIGNGCAVVSVVSGVDQGNNREGQE